MCLSLLVTSERHYFENRCGRGELITPTEIKEVETEYLDLGINV